MADLSGGVYARYEVDYLDRSLGDQALPRRRTVVLIEGYSTAADIPEIVGIASNIKPKNVLIMRMELLGTEASE